MQRFFYSLLLIIGQPLVLLRLLLKSRRQRAYRLRLPERYGFAAPRLAGCIWVHAVSVGETITAQPVIEHLLSAHSETPLVVTTTTPTGAAQLQKLFGRRVIHRYLPQDINGCLHRFMKAVKPQLLVVMETELWPNLVATAASRSVPVVLANGRLSARSAAAYARFPGLVAPMLQALTLLAVQTETERQRFMALGAPAARCKVMPSLKYEATISTEQRQQADIWRSRWQLQQRFVWIAASTHQGEEAIALAAHQELLKQVAEALLILVPRHPERFDRVAVLCRQNGLRLARYSQQQTPQQAEVLLADVMGRLLSLYGLAKVAFVGGSLNGGGGHNIMEPALWALPVITGPGRFNFQDVSEQMQQAGGLSLVTDAEALAQRLLVLQATAPRQQQGAAAQAVAASNRGGLAMLLAELEGLL